VDYYTNALETEKAAVVLLDAELYRQSVYMSCLAVELFLKSKLHLVKYREGLELSHDIVNLYRALQTRFKPKSELDKAIARCRKYFNEARYPYANDTSIYTHEFASEFVEIVKTIKHYIESVCIATIEDLEKTYSKSDQSKK